MKMFLISDNRDTYIGMSLAGVDGVIINSKSHLKEELDKAINDETIAILLITEKFGREFPEIIDDVKMNRKMPLIVEIPDRHGTGRSSNFITSYINEAMGLKL